jgi:RNA polymerase sigma factor (sigma-70 family)
VQGEAEAEPVTIASLGVLYEHRYRKFLRVAEAIVGEFELAHDVVQDAFARVIRRRFEFRSEGDVEGWVWRTVVNTARNARRDRKPGHLPLHELADEPPSTNGHRPDSELRALIASLPERPRLVLFLRYYADLDYARIAEALEIQPATVGATLNQAHTAIRRQLQEVPQ